MPRPLWIAALAISIAACSNQILIPTTGLTGVVVRGPVTPVCVENVPCDAPFSAHFTVRRESAAVTSFLSDSQGRFTVMLVPGTYRIVPAADAGLISPEMQAKTVVVGPTGLTSVRLQFDTGLR